MTRAAVVDRAWRTGKARRGINPEDFAAGLCVANVCWLLRIDANQIWPAGMPDMPGDDVDSADAFGWLDGYLEGLEAAAPDPDPTNADITGYRRTLRHCRNLMDGRAKPEVAGVNGYRNAGGYRRGSCPAYVRKRGAADGHA